QHGARREAAGGGWQTDAVSDVPAGRDRPRPRRQPRSGRLPVHNHVEGPVTSCAMVRAAGFLAAAFVVFSQTASSPGRMEQLADGIRLQIPDGYLSVHVRADSIIRVTFSKTADFRADDMVVVGPKGATSVRWTTA